MFLRAIGFTALGITVLGIGAAFAIGTVAYVVAEAVNEVIDHAKA